MIILTTNIVLKNSTQYRKAIFFLSTGNGIDFLAWRVWVGIWLIVVSLVVAAFQGSILVKHFTKFTKDIFTGLIALLFIISPFEKLAKIFKKHPLKVSISILLQGV